MLDDVWVQTRLESPLFGALVHAVETSACAVEADAAAARVFGGPRDQPHAYVSADRLGVPHHHTVSLHDWPLEKSSLFGVLHAQGRREGVFRPADLAAQGDGEHLVQPIAEQCRVVDVLGIAFGLDDAAWCALVYFRCHHSPGFRGRHAAALTQLEPTLARAVARGLRHDAGLDIGDRPRRSHPGTAAGTPMSAAVLLARLSRTERRVLRHLRDGLTERGVAEQIQRSPHTVHVHVKNIYRKLGVSSRKQLLSLFNRA